MLCSNCGKTIPFLGNTCPYCHYDKSGDQQVHALGVVFVYPAFFLGAIIGGILSGFGGAVIGAVLGIVAVAVPMAAVTAARSERRRKEMEEARRRQPRERGADW
jgi:hypothetical protein